MRLFFLILLFIASPSFANEISNVRKFSSIDKRIQKIDKDGDGLISKEEMLKANSIRIDKIFSKYDKDNDGKLSGKELHASKKGVMRRRRKMKKNYLKRNCMC
tara:strand:- start:813 stop:1121 length:309 start_codon:yes stop_codon:yes gene_type:complete